jgi:hypothetical protein
MIEKIQVRCSDTNRAIGLWNILKTYGVFPIKSDSDGTAHLLILEGDIPNGVDLVKDICSLGGNAIWIYPNHKAASGFDLDVLPVNYETILKPPKKFWFMKGSPKAISRFGARRIGEGLVFRGNGIRPLLINNRGEHEAIAQQFGRGTIFWVGPNVVEEIVRYRQGDPAVPAPQIPYDLVECTCERPMYRYEPVISERRALLPEADIWGWLLVHWIWKLMVGPQILVWPLPHAQYIVSLLTADGDEASKEQVAEMSSLLSRANVPWTLFATPNTAKNESWAPRELNEYNDFAIHPVLYDNDPDNYESTLREQLQWFVEKFGCRPSAVRNHMFFQKGYLDLHEIWEKESIPVNFNLPWCINIGNRIMPAVLGGTFHPFHYRRSNSSWMQHMGIVSPYGDGILFMLEKKHAWKHARRLAKYLIRTMLDYFPGVLVTNFHPYNIEKNINLIEYYINAIKKNGAKSINVSQWLDFVLARNRVSLTVEKGNLTIHIPSLLEGLTLLINVNASAVYDSTTWRQKSFEHDYFDNSTAFLYSDEEITGSRVVGKIDCKAEH